MTDDYDAKSKPKTIFEMISQHNQFFLQSTDDKPIGIIFPSQEEISNKVLNALQKAASTTGVVASRAATAIVESGIRDELDLEIAKHYLDGMKYGLEGSDGSCLSNYTRHSLNHHEILSLCCASRKNPYNKLRHILVLVNKLALAFLLSVLAAAFIPRHILQESADIAGFTFGIGFIISLVISSYGFILEKIARCYYCTTYNVCVAPTESCSVCILISLIIPSGLFIALGVLIIIGEGVDVSFMKSFVISIIFDYLSYFYYGIWNWYLVSWKGFLCLPRFPASLFCSREATCPNGFPPQFCSLLAVCPLSTLLNMIHMGESTYREDKKLFELKYPGRIAIDVPKLENIKV